MELLTWINFIEYSYPDWHLKSNHEEKLMQSCLTELLYQLNTKFLLYRPKYSFSISIAQALSFVIYAKKFLPYLHISTQITINKIIGIIDQKTV